jgi:hypothetical protein
MGVWFASSVCAAPCTALVWSGAMDEELRFHIDSYVDDYE